MADLTTPPTNAFEKLKRVNEHGAETWSARELAKILEYSEFRHFLPVIAKAREACEKSGHKVPDHFEEMLNMVEIGSGAQRPVENWLLSRYACYLVIQNADPSKPLVALGQTYFAVQTRRRGYQESRQPRKEAPQGGTETAQAGGPTEMKPSPPVVLYPSRAQRPNFALRMDASAVWLILPAIANLFGISAANIHPHILMEKELLERAAMKKSLITDAEGRNDRTIVERMLEFDERTVFQGAGRVSNERMKEVVCERYEGLDGRRRRQGPSRLGRGCQEPRSPVKGCGKKAASAKADMTHIDSELAAVHANVHEYLEELEL
jgi:hypothetical protein